MAILINGKKVAGIGSPGKSAYQAAVEGGYQGTEEEFNAALGGIGQSGGDTFDGPVTFNDAAQFNGDAIFSGTLTVPSEPQNRNVYTKAEVDAIKPKHRTVTLLASAWSSDSQTVTVQGILADETKQLIISAPPIALRDAYFDAGICCTSQAENSLTFTCDEVPTEDLTVYIAIQELTT